MKIQEYNNKANELNSRFKSLNAQVNVSPFGGRLEIEVSSVDKAKALNQMFPSFTFTSGLYK
jgi:hypothetical protein